MRICHRLTLIRVAWILCGDFSKILRQKDRSWDDAIWSRKTTKWKLTMIGFVFSNKTWGLIRHDSFRYSKQKNTPLKKYHMNINFCSKLYIFFFVFHHLYMANRVTTHYICIIFCIYLHGCLHKLGLVCL